MCSLGADNYDTLGGRVEALEEKLKNGVPVQMVPAAAAQQAGDVPPPPSDDDAPPVSYTHLRAVIFQQPRQLLCVIERNAVCKCLLLGGWQRACVRCV